MSNTASSACFNAACKWCEDKQYSGGITQGDDGHGYVLVSCYKDIFHEAVTIENNLDHYYEKYRHILEALKSEDTADELSDLKDITLKELINNID